MFILSGPSGVGKDAVLARLLRRDPRLARVVTAVTRPPRPREREGVDYYFVSREHFDGLIRDGALLEWADFVGSPRGTPLFSLRDTLARGQDAVLKIDVEGARQVRRQLPGVVSIMLEPPDLAVLRARMTARGADDEAEIARRLQRAQAELDARGEYDYSVVNRDGELRRTVDLVAAIVTAERARVRPSLIRLEEDALRHNEALPVRPAASAPPSESRSGSRGGQG